MADIVLKDRNGNDVTYVGIKTVTFDTPTEGEQATFTEGIAVEDLEVVPDFSGGDMAVTVPDGTLVKSANIKKPDTLTPENIRNGMEIGGIHGTFIGDTEEQTVELAMADGDMVVEPSGPGKVLSKVTIQKPESLVPENIAEGVNIGGVLGTFAGRLVCASGEFKGANGVATVQHALGVIPDLVYISAKSDLTTVDSNVVYCGAAISSKVKNLTGARVVSVGILKSKTSSSSNVTKAITSSENASLCLDVATSGLIYSGSEDSFKVGDVFYKTNANLTYSWFAVGGLT